MFKVLETHRTREADEMLKPGRRLLGNHCPSGPKFVTRCRTAALLPQLLANNFLSCPSPAQTALHSHDHGQICFNSSPSPSLPPIASQDPALQLAASRRRRMHGKSGPSLSSQVPPISLIFCLDISQITTSSACGDDMLNPR